MERSLRILVADDDSQIREFYQAILSEIGHEVLLVVETGQQLVDQCRRLRPDLVISDIKMPDMDGLDASQQIYREMPTPIILVSSYHDAELIERTRRKTTSCRTW